MPYEFKLPDLGEGLTEGEIARWLVEEGQEIAEDDPLVEIATDKTTVEIPSPAAGVVTSILVAEGEVVPVGTVLVVIGGNGAEPQAKRSRKRRRHRCAEPGTWKRQGARDAARPAARRGARRRPRDDRGHGAAGADHRGRRARRRRAPRRGRRKRAGASRSAASGGRSSSTSRARTGRSRRSPGSRSATSPTSTRSGCCRSCSRRSPSRCASSRS